MPIVGGRDIRLGENLQCEDLGEDHRRSGGCHLVGQQSFGSFDIFHADWRLPLTSHSPSEPMPSPRLLMLERFSVATTHTISQISRSE
jgi:hypothetical protein